MYDKPMMFGSTRDEDKLFMFMNDEYVNGPLSFLSQFQNILIYM